MSKTTVKELIEILQKLPQDIPVIMSSDEGNSYRHVYKDWVGIEAYNGEEGQYDIEVGIGELTSELEEQGYTEEDLKEFPCVVIG